MFLYLLKHKICVWSGLEETSFQTLCTHYQCRRILEVLTPGQHTVLFICFHSAFLLGSKGFSLWLLSAFPKCKRCSSGPNTECLTVHWLWPLWWATHIFCPFSHWSLSLQGFLHRLDPNSLSDLSPWKKKPSSSLYALTSWVLQRGKFFIFISNMYNSPYRDFTFKKCLLSYIHENVLLWHSIFVL